MTEHHPNLNPATATEYVQAAIIRALVAGLLAAGFVIDVNDNHAPHGEHELEASTDPEAILKAIFNPEIDSNDYVVDCYYADTGLGGWVRLIDGNGNSVISDWDTSLDKAMAGANALADQIDAVGDEAWVLARLAKLEAAAKAALVIWPLTVGAETKARRELREAVEG